ncbi:hydroxymethylglutaryl-CoA reductase [Carboxylicivirga mesophila]|uniref:Hydroxymethylglutaryl-CoA reductase n=1 Tax=Carboxylicivirga mesophila TaxID=1166478 RepID=A0ABS5KA21_9BACT|nr:hydroxymethylglutaryl-CoA reductase [Carboxylicivirga mesophila]MBS2211821.1 hydroxymethylglutaryl-CoA reductase [Carboxylicivirga mesophila]
MQSLIKGFSKLSREEKIQVLVEQQQLAPEIAASFDVFLHPEQQHLFNDISENIISNFYLPFSLAPNFLINETLYIVPMVIEESSVVAAASKAAGFWAKNGGFQTRVISTIKNGQLFFNWQGNVNALNERKQEIEDLIHSVTATITSKMRQRGGGIKGIEFKAVPNMMDTCQALIKFQTADSMGANFINTCLETIGPELMAYINQHPQLLQEQEASVIMAILSNYTPECLVECKVSCSIEQLRPYAGSYTPKEFAKRFKTAVDIAVNDPYRAVTHNKGIFNGIDAVVLATGNDFRAIEAGAQAYASRNGRYASLTNAELTNEHFEYTLTVPLALGTVGGLTNNHPMAKAAMHILQQPSAEQLMQVAAAAGMANNFAAVASLVTTGIQKGHMKLHLSNILNAFGANEAEKAAATKHFKDSVVSYTMVENFLNTLRP